MIRLGRREFPVPLWLWAALPLAAVLYAVFSRVAFDLSFRTHLYPSEVDRDFLSLMTQLGSAYLTAFLLADAAYRARTPWYGLPLLYVAAAAAAVLVVSYGISQSYNTVAQFVVGGLIMLAASVRGPGSSVFAILVIAVLVPFLLAIAAALVVTIASRIMTRRPVRSREARKEFWANLGGATAWLVIAMGGYLALRSAFPGRGNAWHWLPHLAAACAALAAGVLHLWLLWRSRREDQQPQQELRVLLLAAASLAALVFMPGLLGRTGHIAMYDYIRPALRTMHVLPTPELTVAGYRIDMPFHDFKVTRGAPHPSGGVAFISTLLPPEYGLSEGERRPRIDVFRRDAYVSHNAPAWEEQRKAVERAQQENPGQDALVRFPNKVPAIGLRTDAFPGLDFSLSHFDPALPWEAAEQVLRRFMQERVHRSGPPSASRGSATPGSAGNQG